MESGVEGRLGIRIRRDHIMSTWLALHAASMILRFRAEQDGRTSYQRVTGNKFEQQIAERGEVVWAIRPTIRGANKWDYRWYEGVWVGVVNSSGENIVLTEEGATRAPHIRRRPERGRTDGNPTL